jgi:RND family efflux transporter MFP subunit
VKKLLIGFLIIFFIVWLGWQIYQKSVAATPNARRQRERTPVAVEVQAVKTKTIQDVGRFTGSLYPKSTYDLASKIAGRVVRLTVQIGETVQPGEVVALIDDEEYRQQVEQASADLQVAEANYLDRQTSVSNARREFERSVALREKKVASQAELDAAEFELKTQQAKLKVAAAQVAEREASLRLAKVRLAYAQIRVPKAAEEGHRVVGQRYVDEGALLAPNAAIVSIMDIGTVIAVIHIIESDYAKFEPGMTAVVTTDAFPGRSFDGRVARIAPLLLEKSREARVEIEIANPDTVLKPGMFVRVEVLYTEHPHATMVPLAAVVKRENVAGVFIVDQASKTARFTPVQLGIVNDGWAEVLEPALSGFVVTLGQHLLEDGAPVMLPEAQAVNRGGKSG